MADNKLYEKASVAIQCTRSTTFTQVQNYRFSNLCYDL